jgi:hypothetical protein
MLILMIDNVIDNNNIIFISLCRSNNNDDIKDNNVRNENMKDINDKNHDDYDGDDDENTKHDNNNDNDVAIGFNLIMKHIHVENNDQLRYRLSTVGMNIKPL